MKNLIRQGDLLFSPVEEIPQANWSIRKNGVLVNGESTGHAHRLALAEPDIAEILVLEQWHRTEMYVRVKAFGARVIHEEHKPVVLAPNTNYKVTRAREYSYLGQLAVQIRD